MAQVLKFASSITRMGSNPDRFVDGIYKRRDKKEYNFVLGESTVSGRRMELHGLVSITHRVSCNVCYTVVAAKMTTKWRLKLHRDYPRWTTYSVQMDSNIPFILFLQF